MFGLIHKRCLHRQAKSRQWKGSMVHHVCVHSRSANLWFC